MASHGSKGNHDTKPRGNNWLIKLLQHYLKKDNIVQISSLHSCSLSRLLRIPHETGGRFIPHAVNSQMQNCISTHNRLVRIMNWIYQHLASCWVSRAGICEGDANSMRNLSHCSNNTRLKGLEEKGFRFSHSNGQIAPSIYGCIVITFVIGFAIFYCAMGVTGDRFVTVIYSNDTLGNIEPCGCAGGRGGLSRRAAYIARIRDEVKGGLILIDSGNLSSDGSKMAVIAKAMRIMGYDAIGVGGFDLQVGKAFWDAVRRNNLTVVMSIGGIKRKVKRYKVVKVNEVKVAIVGLGCKELLGSRDGVWLMSKMRKLLMRLRKKADMTIAISQCGREIDEEFLDAQGDERLVDVLIGGMSWQGLKEPMRINGTIVLPTSVRGESVGKVILSIGGKGKEWEGKYEDVVLDRSFISDAEVSKLVSEYYEEQGREIMAMSARYRGMFEEWGGEQPMEAPFAPPKKCGECHDEEYRLWEGQAHAKAVEILKEMKRLGKDCLRCHSEGYRRKGIVLDEKVHGIRDGVLCTSCHGDGVVHSLTGIKGAIEAKPNENVCRQCHTKRKDPSFEYEIALKKIAHWSE